MPDVRIRAERKGVYLEAEVDPLTHRIRKMLGNIHPPELMLALSRASVGHTVQDVSEHAMIRTEALMRGSDPRPVAGIVQPENAGASFRDALPLVRSLLQDYIAKTGYKVSMNFDEGTPLPESSEWGTGTLLDRLQRIREVFSGIQVDGLTGVEVRIKELAGPRLTVELPASAPKSSQQKYLTLLELELRKKIDPRLEVFLENLEDANIKRHSS